MQNKGLFKLLAFLFIAVSVYQLSYTFLANKVDDEATAYAALQNLLRINELARKLKIEEIMNRRKRYGVSTDVPIPEPIEVPQLNWKIVK